MLESLPGDNPHRPILKQIDEWSLYAEPLSQIIQKSVQILCRENSPLPHSYAYSRSSCLGYVCNLATVFVTRAIADPSPSNRNIVQSARSAAQGMHECLTETFQAILSDDDCKPAIPPRSSAIGTTWWFIPSRKRQNLLQDAARLNEPCAKKQRLLPRD